ncbi:MAG: phenylalanine--tRNA ligase subunit beta [Nitrospirae bacterium]|nr:phenylalanine--tRNA ligase subunit beta [Nitrospirota bacterium]
MKASINWLKEFVEFSLTPQEIAETLTMSGLEVEGMEETENDTLLEVNVPPNRPDCLSINGLAREISAVLGLTLKQSRISVSESETVERPAVEIKDPGLCMRYSARIIRGVRIAPAPQRISQRLELHGIRAKNNVVDITNYVLLEMGHPLHAFDLDKLSGGRIVVKQAGSTDKFLSLDNDEKTLSSETLLIWDKEKPVAIAGVMGGLDTEVAGDTVNILLESACFNPVSVRRTSKRLNLSTESSYRFERGADIEGLIKALDRAAHLIAEIAGGKISALADNYPAPFKPVQIPFKFSKINAVLGIDINPQIAEELLTRLGFKIKREGDRHTVVPPCYRQDIRRDIDVIEEIARLYGYDKIPASLPSIRIQSELPAMRNLLRTVTESLRRSGYSEAINFSFLNPSALDKLMLSPEDARRNLIKIKNPLKNEDEALRTTLIPALLENVRLNLSRGEKSLRLFELSKVFLHSGQKLPAEPLRLSAVYVKGADSLSLWQGKHDGFYDLKGALEGLFAELRIEDYSFASEGFREPYLHPGKSCVVRACKIDIGTIGALHPAAAQAFDISGEIYLLELDAEKLLLNIPAGVTYRPLPKYPYVERDMAIVVSTEIKSADVSAAILNAEPDMIESVSLFDIYTGAHIPGGKKSLAFAIRYRAGDRTFTDSEVDLMHTKIIKQLADSFSAELRS